eukprot:2398545-Prorocentrum_lima.AAC.1
MAEQQLLQTHGKDGGTAAPSDAAADSAISTTSLAATRRPEQPSHYFANCAGREPSTTAADAA